jgi:hypothetical protein
MGYSGVQGNPSEYMPAVAGFGENGIGMTRKVVLPVTKESVVFPVPELRSEGD